MNITYTIDLPQVNTEDNILEDQPFQLVEFTEKKEEFQKEQIKKILKQFYANSCNPYVQPIRKIESHWNA